jgi:hypothetical protein
MGANSKLFLHLRDAEVNQEYYENDPVYPSDKWDYTDLWKVDKTGKIVMQVGRKGYLIHVQYPKSEKVYTYNKMELTRLSNDEKLKYIEIFEK